MAIIGSARRFHELSAQELVDVRDYVTETWPLVGARFVEWASSCLGRTVTLDDLIDPITRANTLLELDSFPVELDPLMPKFWRHHKPRYRDEEVLLARTELTNFIWIFKHSLEITFGEVDFRPARHGWPLEPGELECGFVIHGVPFDPEFPNRKIDFRPIHAAPETSGWQWLTVAWGTPTPQDFTWHHHPDGCHMMLVPSILHNSIVHVGGKSRLTNVLTNGGKLNC